MTNREWIESMSTDQLALWLDSEELIDYNPTTKVTSIQEPSPKLCTLRRNHVDLNKWLNAYRKETTCTINNQ